MCKDRALLCQPSVQRLCGVWAEKARLRSALSAPCVVKAAAVVTSLRGTFLFLQLPLLHRTLPGSPCNHPRSGLAGVCAGHQPFRG